MLLPVPRRVLGVLVPVAIGSGKSNADQIDPPVAVDVVAEVQKGVAVAAGGHVIARSADLVDLPVGRLVPDIADHNVDLPIVVNVEGSHALRAKLLVEIDPLPAHIVGGPPCRGGDERGQNDERPCRHVGTPGMSRRFGGGVTPRHRRQFTTISCYALGPALSTQTAARASKDRLLRARLCVVASRRLLPCAALSVRRRASERAPQSPALA